jgi:hypothetical protein
MRSINISTDVFAKIWANRMEGEESEDAILARLLGVRPSISTASSKTSSRPTEAAGAIRWRHDVRQALRDLGGEASLKSIYEQVRKIRLEHGRSVPANLSAIVRRELEFNSSDSNVFTGDHDWFRSAQGIGKGRWALREEDRP